MWEIELTGTVFPIYPSDILAPLKVGVPGSIPAGRPLNPLKPMLV
jgi:hypothetical protein